MIKKILLASFFLLGIQVANAQLRVAVETGTAFNQYNDVRTPNGDVDKGTFFSLSSDFRPQSINPFIRAEVSYTIIDRHDIQLTAAPLELRYVSYKNQVIDFAGRTFSGDDITGYYKFNTYRLSYRYNIVRKEKIRFGIGASVLLRDARIALEQEGRTAEDTDLGAVPLISFNLIYSPIKKLSILLKGDALVGPQGRAEDIFLGVTYDLIDALELKAGYRLIEGGASVAQVYNFALFHFVDFGLVYTFDFAKDKK
ncbi:MULTISPECIES: hypothetical protein [unclassified Aureispira]|uniref:hypothetical protein n=1 Tax=unclassified Aureispira TaxID=2649989 RepID=UPI0007C8540E|nr:MULTISPECIES: hypothetical protein [unclassified Aureispira]WMX14847.1 hypothetical protein QP953_00515 [Aureispira sp. CCB-E]